MKLYIAGPMRGLPKFNFDAFAQATRILRAMGHEVVSPHEKDLKVPGFDPAIPSTLAKLDMGETMRWDLGAVLWADAIVLLHGWQRSSGARLERAVAESTGREVLLFTPPDEDSGGGLTEAPAWDHDLIFSVGRNARLRESAESIKVRVEDDAASAEGHDVMVELLAERARQDKKWGEQNHEYPFWKIILGEELGEADQEYLEHRGTPHLRKELVQCAAVLVSMIQCGDRNNWWGR